MSLTLNSVKTCELLDLTKNLRKLLMWLSYDWNYRKYEQKILPLNSLPNNDHPLNGNCIADVAYLCHVRNSGCYRQHQNAIVSSNKFYFRLRPRKTLHPHETAATTVAVHPSELETAIGSTRTVE